MSLYKWIWTRIGGRPWTYIIRDSYHGHPLWWLLGLLAAGSILGHLFWGSSYIPGQGGL